MLGPDTVGRLINWKFTQAKVAAEREARLQSAENLITDEEVELIEALHTIFGNVGWFDGALATVVRAAVSTLVGDEE